MPQRARRSIVAWALLGAAASAAAPGTQPNVLLVIADDVGIDRIGAYGAHPDPGHTPVIDQLAAEGLLFRNAYSDPLCSPTRANMLTGRYGFRTGLADALNWTIDTAELGLGETTIAEALPPGYSTAAIGKWHLSTLQASGTVHPLLQGFDHFAGTMTNIEAPASYFEFEKCVDGLVTVSTTYATTDSVDDALDWIAATPAPWFVWLAFNAAHAPSHAPPPELHTFDLPPAVQDDEPLHVKAMIEALDTELGRLLAGIDPAVMADTIVVFVGDNGTAKQATTAPFAPAHAKGTPYEGGIHVPLVVKGRGVAAGAECGALVNTTDLFATVVGLAGGDAGSGVDSVSLVPYLSAPQTPSLRSFVYSCDYAPPGFYPGDKSLRAVRQERYKLLRQYHAGVHDALEMYDLVADPFETDDLLARPLSPERQAAFDELSALFEVLQPPWTVLGGGAPGIGGSPPRLRGYGPLLPDEPMSLELLRGALSAPAMLALATTALNAPLFGGLLVPDLFAPGSATVWLVTDAQGKITIAADWPAGVAPGTELFLQYWVADAQAAHGYSASNGLRLVSP